MDAPPLIDADAMLDALRQVTAGQTTAEGVAAAVSAWFHDPGGGFETLGYGGSAAPAIAPPGAEATAADPRLRRALESLALGALANEPGLGAPERQGLMLRAAEAALSATGGVVGLRGEVGAGEAVLDARLAQQSSLAAAAEMTLADLLRADPYAAATRLEEARSRLETLYALTARLSRLSLAEYLR